MNGLFSHIKQNVDNYSLIKHFYDSKMLKECIVIENTHIWKVFERLEKQKWSKIQLQDLTRTDRKTDKQTRKQVKKNVVKSNF